MKEFFAASGTVQAASQIMININDISQREFRVRNVAQAGRGN